MFKAEKNNPLPPIPDKQYFTIGEVSRLCGLKQHVLRYWEEEFSQLSPAKRRGNRRYYQHKDVLLIRRIDNMVHRQGFTLEGARLQLAGSISEDKCSQRIYDAVRSAIIDLEKVVSDLSIVSSHHGA